MIFFILRNVLIHKSNPKCNSWNVHTISIPIFSEFSYNLTINLSLSHVLRSNLNNKLNWNNYEQHYKLLRPSFWQTNNLNYQSVLVLIGLSHTLNQFFFSIDFLLTVYMSLICRWNPIYSFYLFYELKYSQLLRFILHWFLYGEIFYSSYQLFSDSWNVHSFASFSDQGVFVHVITEFIKSFLILLNRNFVYTRT